MAHALGARRNTTSAGARGEIEVALADDQRSGPEWTPGPPAGWQPDAQTTTGSGAPGRPWRSWRVAVSRPGCPAGLRNPAGPAVRRLRPPRPSRAAARLPW